LDPTDHRDRTRNDGISRPWRKSCWLAQRYDDTEGRPKRVHSKKENHNWGVVGTPRIREHIGSVIGGRVPATQGSSGPCVYCHKPGVRSMYTYVAS
jgi:hypothetical protein